MTLRLSILVLLMLACSTVSAGAAVERGVRVAVLDFGDGETGRDVARRVGALISGEADATGDERLVVLDGDLSGAAARGVGYGGSLNMTLAEARDLGAAIGCDFFITGDAQVVRRSSSERPAYFEAYASIFVVSARTGRLVRWSRPSVERDAREEAERALLAELREREVARIVAAIAEAHASEERRRLVRDDAQVDERDAVINLVSVDATRDGERVREPAPYRRLRPAYTDEAARAEAEATVDVEVVIDADGRVADVEVVRWAGFGLDEAVVSTVKRMNFRPATTLDGRAHASRVLLRYNFRRPVKPQ